MSVVRARVELKSSRRSGESRGVTPEFKAMLHEFRIRRSEAKIDNIYKEHQSFQSKSQKLRKERLIAINKRREEDAEKKLALGEKIKGKGATKLIKKIRTRNKSRRNKKDKEN